MVKIKKLSDQYSVFSKEYDYLISLGHRCCTASSDGYTRKSSFPLDWQITDINLLEKLFDSEFQNFYPDSGVEFVHVYNGTDENGNDTGFDFELTKQTFERRCKRLMDLIKANNRKLLFVRTKYRWYWSRSDHPTQLDQNPTGYDIYKLSNTMDLIRDKFNNNNIDCLYIYNDLSDQDGFDNDPACLKPGLQWNKDGTINGEDLVMQSIGDQLELAKTFEYKELGTYNGVHCVKVHSFGKRVEALAYTSQIFEHLKITDVQDFERA